MSTLPIKLNITNPRPFIRLNITNRSSLQDTSLTAVTKAFSTINLRDSLPSTSDSDENIASASTVKPELGVLVSNLPPLPMQGGVRRFNTWYSYKDVAVYWDGSRIKCQHHQRQDQCAKCGGSLICKHGKRRDRCVRCGGTAICEHNKLQYRCVECGGKGICQHNKIQNQCRECGGSSFCHHGKFQSVCVECVGSQICEHGNRQNTCRKCGGSSFCHHDKHQSICVECGGYQICHHNKQRNQCRDCYSHPQNFCQICTNVYVRNSRWYPLCFRCHHLTHPDESLPRRFKQKQHIIEDYVSAYCPGYDFIYDQPIQGGCSKKKPDMFLDCLTHSLIVEIDEDQHQDYQCENKRMMELFTDLANRPLVVLRFNPDKYVNQGINHRGLFQFDGKNVVQIVDNQDLVQRIMELIRTIKYHVENVPTKDVTIEKLFFDQK